MTDHVAKIEELENKVQGLTAHVDAIKQMFNEQTETNMNLRTNLLLFQKQYGELARLTQAQEPVLLSLNAKVAELTTSNEQLLAANADLNLKLAPPAEEVAA
jgi:outer membrane murein-binding lipoprotein Lpp